MEKQWPLVVRIITLIIFLVGAIWLLRSLAWLVALILVSTLIVYIFYPLLTFLKSRFRLNHGLATGLVFIVFLLFLVFVISLLIPVIYYEFTELVDDIPHHTARIQAFISWLSQQLIYFDIEEEAREFLLGLSENLHQAVEYLAEASIYLIGGAVDFFLVLFLVFYLLYDFQSVREQLVSLVPLKKRHMAEEIIVIVDTNIGTFLRGSLIRCFIVGIITGTVLAIVGMPHAMLLGLIAGIFNFILYIGPYIAAVPAVLLSLSPLAPSPLLIILLYVAIQVLDGMFLAPVVLGRIIKMKPITIIVAILAGGSLAGLLGMILAVPVAGIIKSILDLVKQGPAYREDSTS